MTLQEPGDLGYNNFHVSLFYLAIIDSENILDHNVSIALKNLAKKNAITKEKRLSEFLKMLESSSFDIRDYHILTCWLQLYPRLAIDSQKSVRHLAHQILATYMEKYGAKEFSKYLKTAMPIWLQGLFDDKSIANSVRSDLLKLFSGDEVKVNTKIWMIFHEQIVNYCHAVLIHESASSITDERSESAEEVSMKYERAVNSGLMMLLRIVRLVNTQDQFMCEAAWTQINEILSLDQFWDKLGSCASKNNLNTALLRSYLALISEIFSLDGEGSLRPFTSHLKEIKSVFKIASRRFIKNVKLEPVSDSSSTIMYSTIILPLLNALTWLTYFSKQTQIKIKKNFWEYGGVKSFSRLKDILRLGPCNSEPTYYDSLKKLFTALEDTGCKPNDEFPFVDFSSTKDAKNILQKILLPQFQKLRGHNAFAFKYQGIKCLVHVFELFGHHNPGNEDLEILAKVIFFTFLDGISVSRMTQDDVRVKDSCINYLARFYGSCLSVNQDEMNEDILSLLGEKTHPKIKNVVISGDYVQICTNFYLVLNELSCNFGDAFLQAVVSKLELTYEVEPLEQGFRVLLNAFAYTKDSEIIKVWASNSLAGFVTKDFVELPLEFFRQLLENNVLLDYGLLFNDLYLKISEETPSFLTELLSMISEFQLFHDISLEKAIPDAYIHLLAISRDKMRLDGENDMVLAAIYDPEIFSNLLHSTEGVERQDKLIASIVSRNQLRNLSSFDDETLRPLVSCALEFTNEDASAKFLVSLGERSIVKDLIFDKLMSLEPSRDFSNLARMLSKNMEFMPFDLIESEVAKALDSIDLASLAISNPLSQNINLIRWPQQKKLSPFMLTLSSLLSHLSKTLVTNNDTSIILMCICAEYLADYEFLALSSATIQFTDVISSLNKMAMESVKIDETDIAQVFNDAPSDSLVTKLLNQIAGRGLYTAKQYYYSRVLTRACNPVFEVMSLSTFDNLEILYAKLSNHPLKLATLLCSARKFLDTSPKLDRIRNFVFAEILGVRFTEDICKSGLAWLSIANSFIEVDKPYEILSIHKLGMLVNHLAGWLECDIAFDHLFIPMRTLLASFISQFIHVTGQNVPDKTWTLAVDLCLNNLGMAQLDYDTTALEYFSLKLFLTLCKRIDTNIFTDWKQSRMSIEEEVLGLTIGKGEKPQGLSDHQPSSLALELYDRILQRACLSKEALAENSIGLFETLSNSKNLVSQKIACSSLRSYIYESQQDLILEVQMRKSNISGEVSEVGDLILLNKDLLGAVSGNIHLDDALEKGDLNVAFKYMWSWLLIFDYFKESTYSMKAEYINQLKSNESIKLLFDTIFDTLPLTEQAFLNKLVAEPIEKSEKAKPSQSFIQNYEVNECLKGKLVTDEVYFLLAHLCYMAFQFLGSFALHWFNEVRDVQLKQQVEKFAKRFVSPILISKMLQEVENAKGRLTKSDDTLTIKVNRVTNEIKSVYVIDEQTMEMVIKVPEKFPLASVSVEGPGRLGVKENQWKAWLLASQRVITLTNGSIFDSIELFNKNVNLHFSGFEECAICYSILHQDHSLPSKNCPTCLNKFHAACLYKWFKSSGSSTCPLCRSAFNFNTGKV